MATLNNIRAEDDDEIDGSTPLADPSLTWNWVTWPNNLRRAAIGLIVVVVGMAIAIYAIHWLDKDLNKKLQTQTNLKLQAQTRLKNSDQERSEIERHLPLLRELEQQGIFGEEKRLEWIEHLRATEKRWPGIKLQYAISAQNPLPDPPPPPGVAPTAPVASTVPVLLPNGENAKKFGAFQTEMKLTLRVLHEGDVLAILDELKNANLGRFTLKQCNFKRPSNASGATTSNSNNAAAMSGALIIGTPIESDCVLTWFSMKSFTS